MTILLFRGICIIQKFRMTYNFEKSNFFVHNIYINKQCRPNTESYVKSLYKYNVHHNNFIISKSDLLSTCHSTIVKNIKVVLSFFYKDINELVSTYGEPF